MKHLILIVVAMLFISHLHALERSFEQRMVKRIDTTEVMNYLHDGGDPNKCIILRNSYASSIKLRPLNLAAQENDGFLAQLALENGAAIDHRDTLNDTALSIAAGKGHVPMVKLLIKHGASVNVTDSKDEYTLALKEAIDNNQSDIVKLLVEHGVTVNALTPGAFCPLHLACWKGSYEIVKHLLDKGAGMNYNTKRSQRPLTVAIDRGYTAIAIELIKRGAEVEYEITHEPNVLLTPLELACCKDREIVKALIARKVNVNIVNKYKNRTPLHITIDAPIVSFLIQAGANVNAQDKEGKVPLHDHVDMGRLEIVKILLANKADANIKDVNGNMPLYNAAISTCIGLPGDRYAIMDLLFNAGAKVEFGDFEQEELLTGNVRDAKVTIKLLNKGLIPSDRFITKLNLRICQEAANKECEWNKEIYKQRLSDLQAIKQLCEKK